MKYYAMCWQQITYFWREIRDIHYVLGSLGTVMKLCVVGFSTILLFTNREDEEQRPPAARLTPERSGVVSNPDLNTGHSFNLQFKKIMLKGWVCKLIYG